MNQDSNHPAVATVDLLGEEEASFAFVGGPGEQGAGEQGAGRMMEVDPITGDVVPALDDSPFMSGFQVALRAGGARLFTWVAATTTTTAS